ncbi:hypothetical protein ACVWXN_001472 [Bradyrhizobium sp. i1.4.4]
MARPLHPHRAAAGGFRQQHGIERDVVGRIVPVAAGPLHMLDDDVFGRQLEHDRKIGAQQIDALAVCPDMDTIAVPSRHGAGRRDRGMCDVGTGVLPAKGARSSLRRCRCSGVDDGRFDRLALQEAREIVFVGQRLAGRPGCALAQGFQCGFRRSLAIGKHTGKAAVADDRDEAGNGARRRLVERDQSGTRDVRPQHAAVCQVRQCAIVNEARSREHLVGNVDPLDRMSGDTACGSGLRNDARGGVVVERDVASQLPIAGPDIAGTRDRAVIDIEQRRIDAETLRCGS